MRSPAVELVYPPVVGLTRVLFRALGLRIDLRGAGRVPRSGPVVLASNHVSFLDFTLVGLAAAAAAGPVPGSARRCSRTPPPDRS